MTERSRSRVNRVVVRWICDDVVTTVASSDGVAAETDGAVGETLATEVPVPITSPAIVDWVSGGA